MSGQSGIAPPPSSTDPTLLRLWVHLPTTNRRRLLWLLSQLLERQLPLTIPCGEEGHDEPASQP